jgi:hypothetical protein
MGVKEFANILGVPRILDWSNLTDTSELLKRPSFSAMKGLFTCCSKEGQV